MTAPRGGEGSQAGSPADEALWLSVRPTIAGHDTPGPLIEAHDPDDLMRELDGVAAALVVVDRRRRGWGRTGPRRLAATLAAAGWDVGATWLVAPSPARPRRLVPLDHDGALRWYATSLFIPGSWPAAGALGAIRAIHRLGGRRALAAVAPSYALLVRRDRGTSVRPGALAPLTVEMAGAEASTALVVSSGNDAGSRAVLLAFAPRRRDPIAVVKVSAGGGVAADSLGEHARLVELHASLPETLRATIPRPLLATDWEGRTWTAQSPAPGQSVERSSGSVVGRRGRALEDLRRTAAWTTEYALATTDHTITWDPQQAADALLDPLARLFDAHPTATAATVQARVARWSDDVRGATLPVVGQHLDLAPCNVFVSDDALTVLDWERSEGRATVGLPGRDLLFFVSYWLFLVARANDNAREAAALRPLLAVAGGGEHAEAARHAVWTSLDALGVDRAFLPLLFASLWVERAEHHRARAFKLGRPSEGTPREVAASLRHLALLASAA